MLLRWRGLQVFPFEFYHFSDNWKVCVLSDYIGLTIGNNVSLPADLQSASSLSLHQVQELMSIYGGILKFPNEKYSLSDNFKISSYFTNVVVRFMKILL